nr:STAS domain-containing protein [Noviherbaspirillum aridicola]
MFRPDASLTVGNARAVLAAGLEAIRGGQTEFDLGGLAAVDSSAVATLIAWQRAAREAGRQLAFIGLPANLRSLVDLYGAAELLHLSADPLHRRDLPHH